MQLMGVTFDRFKSIEQSELPTGGLVVLFGVNNSGKSNALEGIHTLLGQFCAEQDHAPSRIPDDTGAGGLESGGLVIHFAGCESPDHPDHALVRAILHGAARTPGGDWDWPGASEAPAAQATLAELRSFWAELFLAQDSPVPREERAQLFIEMVQTPLFRVTRLQVSLVVPRSLLSQPARLTAAALAESGDHPLCEWCNTCLGPTAAGAGIRWPATPPIGALSATLRADIASSLPAVIRVNTTPEGIERDLHRHLNETAGTQHPSGSPVCLFGDQDSGPATRIRPNREQTEHSPAPGADSWLETSGKLATRVTPEIVRRANLLAEMANRVAPGFVRELGSIGIELFPPSMFETFPARLRVVFRSSPTPTLPRAGDKVVTAASERRIGGLETVGSGVGRWVSASLRESAWRLGGTPRQAIYLVDEPEAHLHPAAADSVIEWLIAASERNAGVVIATHSPAFLNASGNTVQLVFARPGPPTSLLPLNDDVFGILRTHAQTIGLKETDFLLLTKGFLIVEGPDDERVLKHFFDKQLARGRIMVLPIHGTGETRSLVTSELLLRLGKRMVLLFDSILTERVNRARAGEQVSLSKEEEAVVEKVLRQVHDPLEFHLVDNPYPDIVCALPDDVVRQVLQLRYGSEVEFPGWNQVINAFQQSRTQVSFKRFLVRYLNLPHSQKAAHEMIDELITEGLKLTDARAAPAALRSAVSSAIAFANNHEPSRF